MRSFLGAAVMLLLAASTPAAARGQAADTAIARIRRDVAAIDARLSRCAHRRINAYGFSVEGGTMDVYRCGGAIRKLVLKAYGETRRATEQYYLTGDRPIFVYRVDEEYDRPYGNVARITHERLYLRRATLLRWLGPNRVARSTRSSAARGRLRELNQSFDDLLDRARTGRTHER